MEDERPGLAQALAFAVAGPAFAGGALALRDATVLPPGLFDAAAALLLAWGLAPIAHRALGPFTATMLRGLGVAAVLVLSGDALTAPLDRAVPPAVLLVLAAALLQGGARASRNRAWAMTGGAALLVVAFASTLLLAESLPEPARIRLSAFIAAALVTVGLVARAVLLRRDLPRFAPMPAGIVLFATLAAAWTAWRSLVAERVANLPLYEWGLGVLLATLVFARLRRLARAGEVPEAWDSAARRHVQDVAPLYDARMGPRAAVLSRYLDEGEGFEAYRAILAAAPTASAAYRDGVAALEPVPPARGARGREAACERRLAEHRALMAMLESQRGETHGHPQPRVL